MLASQAQAQCRLALQLALDVSGSVNAQEYRLQLDGLATALEDPEVRATLLAMPMIPVALSVYEWSGRDAQRVILDWQVMQSEADVEALASLLRSTTRRDMPVSTGLGAAMRFAGARLSAAPGCHRQVLDVSGDGKNNDGPRPQDVASAELGGLVVNALVIGQDHGAAVGAQATETKELISYFRAYVIRGTESFVEVAVGYGDYADAMTRKLIRELNVIVVGQSGQARPQRFAMSDH